MPSSPEEKKLHFCMSPHPTLPHSPAYIRVLLPFKIRRAQKGESSMSADSSGRRFDITPGGQQIHIAFGPNELKSSRHPCFKLGSQEDLNALREKVWEHHVAAKESSPKEADEPGKVDSGGFFFACFLFWGVLGCRRG